MASEKRTYGAEEARAKLPELLERANRGERTIITRHGKPYAVIGPVALTAEEIEARRKAFLELRGSGRGLWGPDAAAFVAEGREDREPPRDPKR